MTGDFAFYAYCYYCRMDDPPSLYPTDGLAFLAVADKNKIATPVWKVQAQRLENLFVRAMVLVFLVFVSMMVMWVRKVLCSSSYTSDHLSRSRSLILSAVLVPMTISV